MHVEYALTDASESVNTYEEALVGCTVQYQARCVRCVTFVSPTSLPLVCLLHR